MTHEPDRGLVRFPSGSACYLVDTLALFLSPGFGKTISTYVVIPSAIAEIWMVGYLLVIGVRTVGSGQDSKSPLVRPEGELDAAA